MEEEIRAQATLQSTKPQSVFVSVFTGDEVPPFGPHVPRLSLLPQEALHGRSLRGTLLTVDRDTQMS